MRPRHLAFLWLAIALAGVQGMTLGRAQQDIQPIELTAQTCYLLVALLRDTGQHASEIDLNQARQLQQQGNQDACATALQPSAYGNRRFRFLRAGELAGMEVIGPGGEPAGRVQGVIREGDVFKVVLVPYPARGYASGAEQTALPLWLFEALGDGSLRLSALPEGIEAMPHFDQGQEVESSTALAIMEFGGGLTEAEPPEATAGDAEPEFLATRAFAGPLAVPPEGIAAYGIVAFPTLPTSADRERYDWTCEAFVSALQSASTVAEERPEVQQMVTFWPVNSRELASELSQAQTPSCEAAVNAYHLGSAQEAIREAEQRGERFGTRRGPFLLAWAPPRMRGQPDALILAMDLSSLNSSEALKEAFQRWQQKIERNPELWSNGWSLEGVRIQVREFADFYGTQLLKMLGG